MLTTATAELVGRQLGLATRRQLLAGGVSPAQRAAVDRPTSWRSGTSPD